MTCSHSNLTVTVWTPHLVINEINICSIHESQQPAQLEPHQPFPQITMTDLNYVL